MAATTSKSAEAKQGAAGRGGGPQAAGAEAVGTQPMLANLAGGASVRAKFMMSSKQVRATKAGTPYLTVTLSDSTGEMRGVYFDYETSSDRTEPGSIVFVEGKVEVYRGIPRIRLHRLEPAPDADPANFIRRASRTVAEMSEEYGQLVRSITDPAARETVKRVLRTDGLYARFKLSPLEGAGYGAWVGGALEHTLRVARLVQSACDTQPEIDRDLVLAAALIHQIGAVDGVVVSPRIQASSRGATMPRGVLSVMRMQRGLGAPNDRTTFQNRLERLVLGAPANGVSLIGQLSSQNGASLELAVLAGAIDMTYSVGARAEANRAQVARVVPMRRVG